MIERAAEAFDLVELVGDLEALLIGGADNVASLETAAVLSGGKEPSKELASNCLPFFKPVEFVC